MAHHVDQCARARGGRRPWPSFGHVAHDDDRQIAVLRDADQCRRDLAQPGSAARRHRRSATTRRSAPQSTITSCRLDLVDVAEDGRQVGLARQVQLVVQGAGTFGAQAHLARRLLGTGVQDTATAASRLGRDLEQQGRFADARLAAEQDRGSGHDAAAEYPVELPDAARAPRSILRRDLRDRSCRAIRPSERRGRRVGGCRSALPAPEPCPTAGIRRSGRPTWRWSTRIRADVGWRSGFSGGHAARLSPGSDIPIDQVFIHGRTPVQSPRYHGILGPWPTAGPFAGRYRATPGCRSCTCSSRRKHEGARRTDDRGAVTRATGSASQHGPRAPAAPDRRRPRHPDRRAPQDARTTAHPLPGRHGRAGRVQPGGARQGQGGCASGRPDAQHDSRRGGPTSAVRPPISSMRWWSTWRRAASSRSSTTAASRSTSARARMRPGRSRTVRLLCRVHLELMQSVLNEAGGPLEAECVRDAVLASDCTVQLRDATARMAEGTTLRRHSAGQRPHRTGVAHGMA